MNHKLDVETIEYKKKVADTNFALDYVLHDAYLSFEDRFNEYTFPACKPKNEQFHRENNFEGMKLAVTPKVLREMENCIPKIIDRRTTEILNEVDFWIPQNVAIEQMERVQKSVENKAPHRIEKIDINPSEKTKEEVDNFFIKDVAEKLDYSYQPPNKEDIDIYYDLVQMKKDYEIEDTVKFGTNDIVQIGLSDILDFRLGVRPESPYRVDWR